MLAAFPPATVVVGIGTVAPPSCHCSYGDTGNCTANYEWTQASLQSFVQWVAGQGVESLAVWRADIAPLYCNTSDGAPRGVAPFMGPVFRAFLQGSSL